MRRILQACLPVVMGMSVLLAMLLPMPVEGQAQVTFYGLRQDNSTYPIVEYYYSYASGSTCYNGQAFCVTTGHGGYALAHSHFVTGFTSQEADDIDRWNSRDYPTAARIQAATTAFNCHAYALLNRGDVWLLDPYNKLYYDYRVVAGTTCDPYQTGDRVEYGGYCHSAKINILAHSTGSPAYAPQECRSKWGASGKYDHGPSNCPYGSPAAIYRVK